MPQMILRSEGLSDLNPIAAGILSDCKNVRVFAFSGNLGAGKTTLIQRLCQALGVSEAVTSPTFTLVNEYFSPQGSVYHFDFYRIEAEEEAYDVGLDEYFDSGAYCFVEWPERIPTLLPPEVAWVDIQVDPKQHRQLTISY